MYCSMNWNYHRWKTYMDFCWRSWFIALLSEIHWEDWKPISEKWDKFITIQNVMEKLVKNSQMSSVLACPLPDLLDSMVLYCSPIFNTLRPWQNGRHFADDIFECIFLNENVWIMIKFSLKFVPKGPIKNTLTLVQIMAWRRPGDKPLSERTKGG